MTFTHHIGMYLTLAIAALGLPACTMSAAGQDEAPSLQRPEPSAKDLATGPGVKIDRVRSSVTPSWEDVNVSGPIPSNSSSIPWTQGDHGGTWLEETVSWTSTFTAGGVTCQANTVFGVAGGGFKVLSPVPAATSSVAFHFDEAVDHPIEETSTFGVDILYLCDDGSMRAMGARLNYH